MQTGWPTSTWVIPTLRTHTLSPQTTHTMHPQIFLAQMSLDTKHTEIAKLEQRAHQREEALVVRLGGGQASGQAAAADAVASCCCPLPLLLLFMLQT